MSISTTNAVPRRKSLIHQSEKGDKNLIINALTKYKSQNIR